jgi:hypothetical protein
MFSVGIVRGNVEGKSRHEWIDIILFMVENDAHRILEIFRVCVFQSKSTHVEKWKKRKRKKVKNSTHETAKQISSIYFNASPLLLSTSSHPRTHL